MTKWGSRHKTHAGSKAIAFMRSLYEPRFHQFTHSKWKLLQIEIATSIEITQSNCILKIEPIVFGGILGGLWGFCGFYFGFKSLTIPTRPSGQ